MMRSFNPTMIDICGIMSRINIMWVCVSKKPGVRVMVQREGGHIYFGVPGANNDLNVLYGSPLFDDEIADIAQECSFVVNGHTYRKVAREEKTLKFKRVQEAARKDIKRAFGVLQDEGFEVNLRDVFVNPAPNIVRDWVERCDLHVRKTKELRDRKTHIDLRQDLISKLWNKDDE
ncbi:zinc finger, CCHC-type containing protein [Tanacetum coccineum]